MPGSWTGALRAVRRMPSIPSVLAHGPLHGVFPPQGQCLLMHHSTFTCFVIPSTNTASDVLLEGPFLHPGEDRRFPPPSLCITSCLPVSECLGHSFLPVATASPCGLMVPRLGQRLVGGSIPCISHGAWCWVLRCLLDGKCPFDH